MNVFAWSSSKHRAVYRYFCGNVVNTSMWKTVC